MGCIDNKDEIDGDNEDDWEIEPSIDELAKDLALWLKKSTEEAMGDITNLIKLCGQEDAFRIIENMISVEFDTKNFKERSKGKIQLGDFILECMMHFDPNKLDVIAIIYSKESTDWRRLLRVHNKDGFHLYVLPNQMLYDNSDFIRDLLYLGLEIDCSYPPEKTRSLLIKHISSGIDAMMPAHLVNERLNVSDRISKAFFRRGN